MSTIICFVVFSAGYPSVQTQRKKATLKSNHVCERFFI